MLNETKGNMYEWVDFTWNPIKGKCIHDCSYCYMKRFPQPEIHLDEKDLKTDLGNGNKIFVGSSTDMFAENVDDDWIKLVLKHCKEFDNVYYFQSKDVKRMLKFDGLFPERSVFGTTIETNRYELLKKYSKAPVSRLDISKFRRKFVTIEPVIDFDIKNFVWLLKSIKPDFINIGADSKKHNLPEPSWHKVQKLISELKKFTVINVKSNLDRLFNH